MPVLETKYDSKGNEIGVRFNPTAKMLEFVMHRTATKNLHKTNEEICQDIGITTDTISHWQSRYGQHFSEWLHEELEMFAAPFKDALENIGKRMALRGDYNFWRDMAKTYGVIKNEVVELNVISHRVKALEEMSPEELKEYEKKLLADARGEDESHKA